MSFLAPVSGLQPAFSPLQNNFSSFLGQRNVIDLSPGSNTVKSNVCLEDWLVNRSLKKDSVPFDQIVLSASENGDGDIPAFRELDKGVLTFENGGHLHLSVIIEYARELGILGPEGRLVLNLNVKKDSAVYQAIQKAAKETKAEIVTLDDEGTKGVFVFGAQDVTADAEGEIQSSSSGAYAGYVAGKR
ncbi:MAG: hypothetical protein V4691_04580 [Pseudomonadota bacterium]